MYVVDSHYNKECNNGISSLFSFIRMIIFGLIAVAAFGYGTFQGLVKLRELRTEFIK